MKNFWKCLKTDFWSIWGETGAVCIMIIFIYVVGGILSKSGKLQTFAYRNPLEFSFCTLPRSEVGVLKVSVKMSKK